MIMKSLRISPSARMLSTVGEIVNLMSVDSSRYNELMNYLNSLWIAPFQVALALYFLWGLLGGAALAGFAALFIIIPINLVIVRITKRLEVCCLFPFLNFYKKIVLAKIIRLNISMIFTNLYVNILEVRAEGLRVIPSIQSS